MEAFEFEILTEEELENIERLKRERDIADAALAFERQKREREEYFRHVMAIAVKATGLSESQIREQWESPDTLELDMPLELTVEQNHRRRLMTAGVPQLEAEIVTDSGFQTTDPVAFVADFIGHSKKTTAKPRGVLALVGGTGCGKTVGAVFGLDVCQSLGMPCHFLSAKDLLSIFFDDKTRWAELCSPRSCVVVDDLGTEVMTAHGADHWVGAVESLVRSVVSGAGFMVITSNLSATDFVQRYGARVADRIAGHGEMSEFNGESLRGRK